MPAVARFGLGAAIESCFVFLLLLAGLAQGAIFLAGGLLAIAALIWLRPPKNIERAPLVPWPLWIVFGVYGALYLINALAPEIQPDAAGYHLGLVSEYARLGRFPARVGFYEMVPQGLEMLFTAAFAFGRHSAAKLVHFAFLAATVPLLVSLGRRLELDDRVSLTAAALYFCAPVVGVSGTSAYNDAGLVFFVLLTLYFLLAKQWAQAGIAAGFCFAIKITGLIAAPAGIAFTRRLRPSLMFSAAALVMIAPWTIRDLALTGNPVAPLFNRVFPNPYFRPATDERLRDSMKNSPEFHWRCAALDYTLRGNLQGAIGPVFLLLPFALAALKTRAGRTVWAAAIIALAPWFWNVGARFLMPALPFFALALVMIIPKRAAWACVMIQAVACWPAVMAAYAAPFAWRLQGMPWKAALRIEPEPSYLAGQSGDYQVARMVEQATKPSDRIFALDSLAMAYCSRDVLIYWQSAEADRLLDALTAAVQRHPILALTFDWSRAQLRGVRFRAAASGSDEWRIFETRLSLDEDRVFNSPMWLLNARPNLWDAPLAIDDNRATFWRTSDPVARGMFIQIEFDHPQNLSRAELLCEKPASYFGIEVDGLATDGRWRVLRDAPRAVELPAMELRREAVQALKKAGMNYVLAGSGGQIGRDMAEHGADWGLMETAVVGDVRLFRII